MIERATNIYPKLGGIFSIAVGLLVCASPEAQVTGSPTGDCNYNDGRGWVRCGDYPGTQSSPPTPEELERRRVEEEARAREAERLRLEAEKRRIEEERRKVEAEKKAFADALRQAREMGAKEAERLEAQRKAGEESQRNLAHGTKVVEDLLKTLSEGNSEGKFSSDGLDFLLQRAQEEQGKAHERARQAAQPIAPATKSAGEQLKSAEHHGKEAQGLEPNKMSKEAQRGFDTGGDRAGSLAVPVVHGQDSGVEPVVPKEKRTPVLIRLEEKRDAVKKDRAVLEKQLADVKAQPNTPENRVTRAKLEQKISTNQNEKHFLDFSIQDQLDKTPADVEQPKGEQKQ